MKPFYCILFSPIRPTLEERLSIAFLAVSNNKVYFRYSHDKLSIVKSLIPANGHHLLKSTLSAIDNYVNTKNNKYNSEQLFIDGLDFVNENMFRYEYLEYLNNYSNNLLHFSKPSYIDIDINDDIFDKLYQKYVHTLDKTGKKKENIINIIKESINSKIEGKVNLNKEIDSNIVPNLVVPTKVWFIGKNEIDVTGQVFDFSKQNNFLENDISKHINLLQTFRLNKINYVGTHFITGNEPAKNNIDNHKIWDEIRKLSYIEFVPTNELEQVSTYIKSHNVQPFVPITIEDNTSINDEDIF